MAGQHGAGMIHLAWRAARAEQMKDAEYRFGGTLANVKAAASESRSTATRSPSWSASKANRCTSSALPSSFISMSPSTSASASARTCRRRSIPPC